MGGATRWLMWHRIRCGSVPLLALALVVTLAGGGALLAIGAAQRTSGAYADYLERAEVGDLVVNPAMFDREVDAAMRSVTGVRQVTHDAMFLAGIDDGRPRTRAELEGEPEVVLVRGSPDGRGIEMDRPAIAEGRAIAAPDEALVSRELADRHDYEPGTRIPVAFWNSSVELVAEPDDIVRAIAVEELTIVGIATLPNEVLPDDLYPRGQVIVSPEVARRYTCLPAIPPRDTSIEDAIAQLLPDGCSTSYPYYSFDLEDGPEAVPEVVDELTASFEQLNRRLPTVLTEQGSLHAVIATTTADEQARVERSVQPTATALGVLAVAAAALAVLVGTLTIARELRRAELDVALWRQLGFNRRRRALVLAAPAALAIVVGAAVAVAGAWLLSPLAPVGAVRVVDPSPARQLTAPVLAAVGVLVVALLVALGLLARRGARRVEPRRVGARARRRSRPLVRASGSPAVGDGLRAAIASGRSAGVIATSGGLAVGVLLTAVVFGATLGTVLSTPADYGWRWDAGLLGGFGYGSLPAAAVRDALADRDDIDSWDGLSIGAFVVDGLPVTGLAGLGDGGDVRLTMASGRAPTGPGEVALGARTADDLGVGIGDRVEISGDALEPVEVTVTGIAVLPGLGPYQSDRAAPGIGVVVSPEVIGREHLERSLTFVGLDLADGADAAAVVTEVRDALASSWDFGDDLTRTYDRAVRPPEIVDADAVRRVPLVVGGLLAAAAVLGLVTAIVVSVRSRRRELGILRALGFTSPQLRTSVRVQALATMAIAVAVGVPAGLGAGRLAWRSFASRLGIVTAPTMPWAWILGTIAAALVVALLAAAGPARAAARLEVTRALRPE